MNNSTENKHLDDVLLDNNPISHAHLYAEHGNMRLYATWEEEIGNGFKCTCIEWISNSSKKNSWDNPEIIEVFRAIAYFDGIRHLWFNYKPDDICDGYLYYPDTKNLLAMIKHLYKLEVNLCRDI